ncbi:MAG: DedA family protein [Magnetococcales bacterium]|nr:DedA family protein [Magnetococcales bacterium]
MNSELFTLFLASLLAATVLPFSSEALLTAMVLSGEHDRWPLWLAATLGNVAGAQINWLLGRYCLRFQTHRWFPVSPDALEKARERFLKWGEWSLLLAWVPIIGDPITFAAGAFKVSFIRFSILVLLGKGGRYLLLMAAL